jgi:O-acetyl-ADP-ribose deacetylase (regulator of RNase III)
MTERVEIIWKDYATFPAEAIVNSSNQFLILGSNVSDRLAEIAGQPLVDALARIMAGREGRPFPLGAAVETPPLGIGAPNRTKFLIHAVTLGAREHPGEYGRTLATVETIFLAACNSVILADRLGCETILFPVMAARPGYTTLECDPRSLRWAAATAMVVGIRRALRQTQRIRHVFISAWSPQSRYQDEDVQMLRALARENAGPVEVADIPFSER